MATFGGGDGRDESSVGGELIEPVGSVKSRQIWKE